MQRLVITILVGFLLFVAQDAISCEIKFKVLGEKKKEFAVGEEIIVRVDVVFTHRVCPEGIKNTKFKYNGVTVLCATKWAETSKGKFQRKLKLKVSSDDKKKMVDKSVSKD